MEIIDLVEPVDFSQFPASLFEAGRLGAKIKERSESKGTIDFDSFEIVILGVLQVDEIDQSRENYFSLRESMYGLFDHFPNLKVRDLGNVKSGHSLKDTRVALNETLNGIYRNKSLPIVLSNEVSFYELLMRLNEEDYNGNLIWFDSKIPQLEGSCIKQWNCNLKEEDHKLFMVLGTQKYFNSMASFEQLSSLGGSFYGVGKIRDDIRLIEPELRDAHAVGVNIDCMKSLDTPGSNSLYPNGLVSTEMCQMMWYYGMSTAPSSLSFWGYHKKNDASTLGANSIAQMVWHFMLGLHSRTMDFFLEPEAECMDHHVIPMEEYGVTLFFIKHKITERWWFAVQYNNLRSDYVSCLKEDYELSRKGEISQRLWKYIVHKRMDVVHNNKVDS